MRIEKDHSNIEPFIRHLIGCIREHDVLEILLFAHGFKILIGLRCYLIDSILGRTLSVAAQSGNAPVTKWKPASQRMLMKALNVKPLFHRRGKFGTENALILDVAASGDFVPPTETRTW